MTTDGNAVIKVEGLEKSFGDNKVLKGIDIEIDKGEVIVVIGASGSGKSTFLRCLNCLEDPTGGHIYFDGADITDTTFNGKLMGRDYSYSGGFIGLNKGPATFEGCVFAPEEIGEEVVADHASIFAHNNGNNAHVTYEGKASLELFK